MGDLNVVALFGLWSWLTNGPTELMPTYSNGTWWINTPSKVNKSLSLVNFHRYMMTKIYYEMKSSTLTANKNFSNNNARVYALETQLSSFQSWKKMAKNINVCIKRWLSQQTKLIVRTSNHVLYVGNESRLSRPNFFSICAQEEKSLA